MWDSESRSVGLNHLTDQISNWLISSPVLSVNFGQFRGHWFTTNTLRGNFDFMEDSFSAGLLTHFISAWLSIKHGGRFCLFVWVRVCVFTILSSHVTPAITQTHTDACIHTSCPLGCRERRPLWACCAFMMTLRERRDGCRVGARQMQETCFKSNTSVSLQLVRR